MGECTVTSPPQGEKLGAGVLGDGLVGECVGDVVGAAVPGGVGFRLGSSVGAAVGATVGEGVAGINASTGTLSSLVFCASKSNTAVGVKESVPARPKPPGLAKGVEVGENVARAAVLGESSGEGSVVLGGVCGGWTMISMLKDDALLA